MKKAHTEEQILRALHHAGDGAKVADICRGHGVSEVTYAGKSGLNRITQPENSTSGWLGFVGQVSLDGLYFSPEGHWGAGQFGRRLVKIQRSLPFRLVGN